MTLEEIYKIIDAKGISVYDFPMNEVTSLSMPHNNSFYIAVDTRKTVTKAHEKVCVAHELSHCLTYSFYYEKNPLDVRGKKEYIADKATIKALIPKYEFYNAIRNGITEPWELAEYFEVPDDYILKAMKFYKNGWV